MTTMAPTLQLLASLLTFLAILAVTFAAAPLPTGNIMEVR